MLRDARARLSSFIAASSAFRGWLLSFLVGSLSPLLHCEPQKVSGMDGVWQHLSAGRSRRRIYPVAICRRVPPVGVANLGQHMFCSEHVADITASTQSLKARTHISKRRQFKQCQEYCLGRTEYQAVCDEVSDRVPTPLGFVNLESTVSEEEGSDNPRGSPRSPFSPTSILPLHCSAIPSLHPHRLLVTLARTSYAPGIWMRKA